MFFDLKSYLVGKHGGAYTPSADLPSYLMGRAKSGKIQEITGTLPLAVRSRASQVLKNYIIYGESVQDDTPTPDNPVEVAGLGVRTDNLFGKDSAIIMNNTALYSDGTATREIGSYCAYIPCKGNTKYTISKTPSMRLRVGSTEGIPDINMRVNNYYNSTSTKLATITTSGNDKYLFIYYYSYVNGDRVPEEDIRATIMVVEGSTAPSSYIPYGYQLPMIVRTENLFDYEATTVGYISSSGSAGTASGNHKTDYLSITPSETYTLDFDRQLNSAGNYLAWYDENKVVIAGSTVDLRTSSSYTIVAPVNAKYVRFSVKDSILSVTMFTKSSTAPDHYIPYYNTETPIYIGDSQLMEGEYVDYEEQKIYKLVDGVLTPTEPPVPLPDITLPQAEVTIDIDGELKPRVTIKGEIKQI